MVLLAQSFVRFSFEILQDIRLIHKTHRERPKGANPTSRTAGAAGWMADPAAGATEWMADP
jgi:hypothetical protein